MMFQYTMNKVGEDEMYLSEGRKVEDMSLVGLEERMRELIRWHGLEGL
jgi:hypothetical protein